MKIALALLLLSLTTITAHADNIPPVPRPIPYISPRPVQGTGLYFVNLAPVDGDTYFRYELRSGTPAVSHVTITVCTAKLVAVIADEDVTVEVAASGIKLETPNMADNATQVVTLVMAGAGWSAVPTAYTIKAGQRITSGDTYGPLCNATAVTLSGLSAGIDGIQARDIVLLTLIAAMVLLVRWALNEGKRGN